MYKTKEDGIGKYGSKNYQMNHICESNSIISSGNVIESKHMEVNGLRE